MSSSAAATVSVGQDGHVGRLTLNRPEKRNALNAEMLEAIQRVLVAFDADETVSVVVISGAGPSFCGGYDISADGDPDRAARRERGDVLQDWQAMQSHSSRWLRLRSLATPTIAAVQGYCLGGGAELALLCDLVIAAEDAVIGHPVVRDLGVPTLAIYPYLVGLRKAKEMMLTGRCMSGSEAAQTGLINHAVPAADLDAYVERYAREIASVPKPLLALNKRAVDNVFNAMGLEEAVRGGATLDALAHTTASVRATVVEIASERSIGARKRYSRTSPTALDGSGDVGPAAADSDATGS